MPDVRKTVTDAGYIAIGLGVMGFQQAQARRRELQQRLESASSCLGERARDAAGKAEEFANELGHRVEPLIERFDGFGDLPERVNKAAKPVYDRVRELVGSAA